MAEVNLQFWADIKGITYPVTAATVIEKGHFVGINPATGYAREFEAATDLFAGICRETVDNSAGANGDINVITLRECMVEYAVTGGAITKNLAPVYAKDNSVLDVTGTVEVGVIEKWLTGTTCIVNIRP